MKQFQSGYEITDQLHLTISVIYEKSFEFKEHQQKKNSNTVYR